MRILFSIFVLLLICGCGFKDDTSERQLKTQKYLECWAARVSEHRSTICVEGHEYYIWLGCREPTIAPKLNDDGTPYKCN